MNPASTDRNISVRRVTVEMLLLSSYALMTGVAVSLAVAGVVAVLAFSAS